MSTSNKYIRINLNTPAGGAKAKRLLMQNLPIVSASKGKIVFLKPKKTKRG